MEPNKLENEFRKKLNSREIEPSSAAWDRLDAMLTVGETKKETPVRKLNWLFIAAGIVGFLFIGMMLFNRIGNTTSSNDSVVVSAEDTTTNEIMKVRMEDQLPETASQPANTAVVSTPQLEKPAPKEINPKTRNRPNSKTSSEIAINDKRLGTDPSVTNNPINHPQVITEKAAVNVDELLASASQAKNESKPKAKLKVDPSSLLSQVDGELELSFREKTINTLGKKYNNVKVALANRNKE